MRLQAYLSALWGAKDHPAEWDGRNGNGGKGSQRYWEYLWALNQMHLPDHGVPVPEMLGGPIMVLDVGSGETQFFPKLLQFAAVSVKMIDPILNESIESYAPKNAIAFKWVTCISVLEHVSDKVKFCEALDSFDAPIVMTFEFGPGGIEQKEMYRAFGAFKRHYIISMELCPVWADNSAPDRWRPMGVVLRPVDS